MLRVEEPSLQRSVALKLLTTGLDDPHLRARFLREAQLTARIEHPHVVRVLDSGLGPSGLPWIAYECLEGASLEELLERPDRVPTHDLVAWVDQIADALQAAHAAGVVHRDVKPANVMIRAHGEAVLCDFGIARPGASATTLTATGQILGTPAYMAPELFRAQEANPATDAYALAAVLFEAVAGAPLWGGADLQATVAGALSGASPRLPRGVAGRHPALSLVIERALAPRPQDRYPDLTSFRRALAEAMAPAGPEDPTGRATLTGVPPGRTPPVRGAPGKQTRALGGRPVAPPARGLRVLAGFLVLAGALGWGGAALRTSRAPPPPIPSESPPAPPTEDELRRRAMQAVQGALEVHRERDFAEWMALMERDRRAAGEELRRPLEAWRRVAAARGAVLTDPRVPRDLRRQVLLASSEVAFFELTRRQLPGGDVLPAPGPRPGAGDRLVLARPLGPAAAPLRLEVVDGAASRGAWDRRAGGWKLENQNVMPLQGFPDAVTATRQLPLLWPRGADRGDLFLVAVSMVNWPPDDGLDLLEGGPGEPTPWLRFCPTRLAQAHHSAGQEWVGILVPRDLLPGPGTPLVLRMCNYLSKVFYRAYTQGVLVVEASHLD